MPLALFGIACGQHGPTGQCGATPPSASDVASAISDWQPNDPCTSSCGPNGPQYSVSHPLGYYEGDPLPKHTAYLTFDDGPCDFTPDFLDILKDKGVHATFFVNAKNTKKAAGLDGIGIDANGQPFYFRDALKRELDEGHVIGNHTVDHADLGTLSRADAETELDENERLVNAGLAQSGTSPVLLTLVRPPYSRPWQYEGPEPADYDATVLRTGGVVAGRGPIVFFNVDSTDSADGAQGETYMRNPPRPPVVSPSAPTWAAKVERIKQTVLNHPLVTAGEGVVIIFHDIHPTSRDALPDVIDGLRAAGYSFATMEDYASWRWGRPSIEMTPGPSLYDVDVAEKDWGCQSFDVPVGTGPAHEVCGRMWLGFQALGGLTTFGKPASATTKSADGTISQAFECTTLQLSPSNALPQQFSAVANSAH
jgi:peptidoglycan/xylan/chitin deacetylase (PgdA/CDA1 family)